MRKSLGPVLVVLLAVMAVACDRTERRPEATPEATPPIQEALHRA